MSAIASVTFSHINIQPVTSKVDDLHAIWHDHSVDILCLTETWNGTDSVAFCCLCTDGFSVIDRPWPALNNLLTKYSVVAVVATGGVQLSPVPSVTDSPSSFELLCVQVTSGQFAAIVIVNY